MIGSVLLFIGVFAHRLMLMFPAFNVIPLSLSIPGAGIESWACDLSHTKSVILITALSTDSLYTKPSQIE